VLVIHIYLEISHGNFLWSYLYIKQAKMSCFSFYLFYFLFCKISEQDSGREEMMGKEERGRVWCRKCVHMYVNIKVILLKLLQNQRMWG
jgi:hypothetical protein